MRASGYLYGQNYVKRYKLGASGTSTSPGIIYISNTTSANATVSSTTAAVDALGLSVGTGTYSTTQGDAEGTIELDINPGLIVDALMSGGAADGTALTLLSNTAAETAGTVITDADVGTNDMTGGTVWRYFNPGGGESRTITTHSSGTSFTVTVPFTQDIAAADEFLFCPWNETGDGTATTDGNSNLQATTSLLQANATIASGTGLEVVVVDLVLRGRNDSHVRFVIGDHVFGGASTI